MCQKRTELLAAVPDPLAPGLSVTLCHSHTQTHSHGGPLSATSPHIIGRAASLPSSSEASGEFLRIPFPSR